MPKLTIGEFFFLAPKVFNLIQRKITLNKGSKKIPKIIIGQFLTLKINILKKDIKIFYIAIIPRIKIRVANWVINVIFNTKTEINIIFFKLY